jgi:hypothetical protein
MNHHTPIATQNHSGGHIKSLIRVFKDVRNLNYLREKVVTIAPLAFPTSVSVVMARVVATADIGDSGFHNLTSQYSRPCTCLATQRLTPASTADKARRRAHHQCEPAHDK